MIRVLVVDDHAVVRAGLAAILGTAEDLQCVGLADDGVSALQMAERLRSTVLAEP